MIDYKKAKLDKDTVDQLIKLSYQWEEEDITFGLHHNTESDLHEPCYIALDGNEIVGYIFGHYYNNEKIVADIAIGDKCFDVDEIYIKKEYRNKGIGKELFLRLEAEVKQEAKWLTLPTSSKDYKKVLHFYDEVVGMTFHSAFLFKKF